MDVDIGIVSIDIEGVFFNVGITVTKLVELVDQCRLVRLIHAFYEL